MQRTVLAALCVALVLAVGARASEGEVDIELQTHNGAEMEMAVETGAEAPVLIRRPSDPPVMTRAFTARGGRAEQLDSTTLLIDNVAVVRVARVEGQLSGKNAEFTMQLTAMPRAVRKWLRRFITGKYKKHEISIITKTPGTGVPGTPMTFTRFDYKGVLIREVTFPRLGVADGAFKVRVLYQSADEKANVKQRAIADGNSIVRTQFFKLSIGNKDSKQKDKAGKKMGKSVHTLGPFSITRSGGFGKQDAVHLKAHFPASHGKGSAADAWANWLTQPTALKDENPKQRVANLTLYYWSGASMDRTAGDAAAGQLKKLFTLTLNDVTIDKLESGEGVATLKVDSIDMNKQ